MGVSAGLLLLCVLIVIHELGHFWVAKLLGVRVLTFSVGFGPKLLKITLGGTEYALSAIPLGGYVKMLGESPDEILSDEDKKRSFLHQPIWRKSLIAFAGPFFNLVLPVFLFFSIFIGSQQAYKPILGDIIEGKAGAIAGLHAGDLVTSINHQPIQSFVEMVQIVSSHPGQKLDFEVLRDGQKKNIQVIPDAEKDNKVGRIGVKLSDPPQSFTIQVGPLEALKKAYESTVDIIKLTVMSLWMLINAEVSPKELGGPLMIMSVASQAASQGWAYYLQLMALISVNLGLLNLLPVPVLDGGHLFMFGIEAVTRRPINAKVRQIATQIGLALLLSLMAVAMFNDVMRLMH
ncbi:MAG: RIP metalloprotease RseP [Myxococcaceae bacterium]